MQNDEFDQGLICPSFNSYSDDKLAAVAAKVCLEFTDMKLTDGSSSGEQRKSEEGDKNDIEDGEDDDEFEFVPFQNSGNEFFLEDNRIGGPVFPVFNRDLLFEGSQRDLTAAAAEEDNYYPPSSSSSDVDELEAVPPGMYCVWTPKPAAAEESRPGKCKKSRSTGTSSSRRWCLKDLLRRSNSEGGKDSLVLLTPSSSKNAEHEKVNKKTAWPDGPRKSASGGKSPSGPNAVSLAHEAFYVRNKTVAKDGYNKRRSYLPYRQDLVGFFASVNAMSRTFPAL